ncbi:MAG: tetratricopeptide repeat protein [Candidatus Yanofskybacteria bacterium]|nr:tetratricopeptide repeat protein [Candidatus Yanofskybacteria bacterium]
MYLIIPLFIIFVSLFGVMLIVWRKIPYLKKITNPAPISFSESVPLVLLSDFFPEVANYLKKSDLTAYRNHLMKELEKFLRRLRVLSLKLDSFTNKLLAKIKSENLKNGHTLAQEFKEAAEVKTIQRKESFTERAKKEEQALIIEIAKNPKNPELYKKLAEVYLSVKNFSDAKESLETALELDPEDQQTREKLETVRRLLS